jgi:Tfp pilus assembly protein PilO
MNTENKILKTYKYSLSLGAITLVGAIAIGFLVISPLYKKTQSSATELAAKEVQYEELVVKKTKLDGLKDKEAELKKQAALVSDALPKDEEVGRMFIQLDALAKASNGSLKSVSKTTANVSTDTSADLSSAGITKTVYSLPLTLPTYFDLKSFIANADSALRLISINDLNISASDTGSITVNLTANAYTRN